jgi:DNA-binding NtrC family response regulator
VLAGNRVLIIEDEFLIALDMQRALEAAGAAESVLARNFAEAAALGDSIAGFDVVILHPPPPGDDRHPAVIDRIRSGGLALVVCSAFRGAVTGTSLADAVFLGKPFSDEELIAACVRALALAEPR